ncbi:Alpha/Beta hydrolase protein [Kickxella alabastrina]|uniref:Alpha/Beta hydrolase protein n=1 Tax=Kickxella alabastrina TaxID=61397 RepID=UPI0022205412|nr:Alpha/Beta hydrolase protein [Kickxella alabastrina]KAI7824161.1 Alpha/Beta hydrolase protein [Kickxella alabastrina]
MLASVLTGRIAQFLKHRLGVLGSNGIRIGTGSSWLYSRTATVQATQVDVDDSRQAKVNAQALVKPIYIAPRNPIVLCHGLYGFDVRGPEKLPLLQVHYWRGIREALEKIGARVVIAKVPGTGGVHERAHQLDTLLASQVASTKVNILGHSMGGLDARYLIAHIKPKRYSVGSLTSVCTPHRGSPFMDWCRDYLSLGYRVDPDQLIRDFATVWRPQGRRSPVGGSAGAAAAAVGAAGDVPDMVLRERIGDDRLREFAHFLTKLLGENASVSESSQLLHMSQKAATGGSDRDYLDRSMVLLRMVYRRIMATLDTPAYACLTTDYCTRFFNPATPNAPGVQYLSVGAFMDSHDLSDKLNPLIIPHDIIEQREGANDGFVSLRSARWGEYLGCVRADHFDFTNRWRVTSLGRDFIGTVVYWGGKWSSWVIAMRRRGRGRGRRQWYPQCRLMPGWCLAVAATGSEM